jgi:hypothetical protein
MDAQVTIPVKKREFSLLQMVLTTSGSNPTSGSIETEA